MDIENYKKLMQKALAHLENEFASLQVGRASTGLVENIKVYIPSWDMKQNLSQMANITILDAQNIKVEPWDKGTVSSIEKGIYDSGTGLTPRNMGDYIMIGIPPLTKERRQDLTKLVAKYGEDAKISIRNIRHDATKESKKLFEEKTISEDQRDQADKKIDELTKEFNTKIDTEVKNKSAEIMKI